MKLAFCLFHYFPFGGLQRDMLRILQECVRRGHEVAVFTMNWQGDRPENVPINIINVSAKTNHQRCWQFAQQLPQYLQKYQPNLVVGFNKIPHLGIYYAADTCFAERLQQRPFFYRWLPRYKTYFELEKFVFNKNTHTEILLIAEREQAIFQKHYQTSAERFQVLPPGIARDRCRPANAEQIRLQIRQELKINEQQFVLLMVASRFKTKGLDRALHALHSLPKELRANAQLLVIGDDKPQSFSKLIQQLQLNDQVKFLGGRKDVANFLLAADLLIHPAYVENTGTVLLEALVAGLPVLTTANCGYASYITQAQAGSVVTLPFTQQMLNQELAKLLHQPILQQYQNNALCYAAKADLFSMPERVVDHIENCLAKK